MLRAFVPTALLMLVPVFVALAADSNKPSDAKGSGNAEKRREHSSKEEKPANSKTKKADAKTKSKRLPGITRGREAAVMTFVRDHHPQLEALLVYLKRNNPTEFRKAFLELFEQSERLARIQEIDEVRYELELKRWKTESRIKLLVARLRTNESPELLEELRGELAEQVRLRILLMKGDRKRMEERIKKLDERIDRLSSDPETEIARQMRILTSSAKRTSNVSTKPGDGASKNPVAPK